MNHSLKKDTVRGFNPPEKYVRLKLDHFPNVRGEHYIYIVEFTILPAN